MGRFATMGGGSSALAVNSGLEGLVLHGYTTSRNTRLTTQDQARATSEWGDKHENWRRASALARTHRAMDHGDAMV